MTGCSRSSSQRYNKSVLASYRICIDSLPRTKENIYHHSDDRLVFNDIVDLDSLLRVRLAQSHLIEVVDFRFPKPSLFSLNNLAGFKYISYFTFRRPRLQSTRYCMGINLNFHIDTQYSRIPLIIARKGRESPARHGSDALRYPCLATLYGSINADG